MITIATLRKGNNNEQYSNINNNKKNGSTNNNVNNNDNDNNDNSSWLIDGIAWRKITGVKKERKKQTNK